MPLLKTLRQREIGRKVHVNMHRLFREAEILAKQNKLNNSGFRQPGNNSRTKIENMVRKIKFPIERKIMYKALRAYFMPSGIKQLSRLSNNHEILLKAAKNDNKAILRRAYETFLKTPKNNRSIQNYINYYSGLRSNQLNRVATVYVPGNFGFGTFKVI